MYLEKKLIIVYCKSQKVFPEIESVGYMSFWVRTRQALLMDTPETSAVSNSKDFGPRCEPFQSPTAERHFFEFHSKRFQSVHLLNLNKSLIPLLVYVSEPFLFASVEHVMFEFHYLFAFVSIRKK
jgi:hypothetical protein